MKKEQKNRGFSLVELIVVVAIMGVLMTVLAPSLLKYVEKSRLQGDNSGIAEICNSIKIALSDEDINNSVVYNADGKYELPFTKDAAGVQSISFAAPAGTDNRTALVKELEVLLGPGFETSSNKYKAGTALKIVVHNTGTIEVENYFADVDAATAITENF